MSCYHIEGDGPGASIARTLQDLGFNVGNERDLSMGMVAYNAAMLVWHSHLDEKDPRKVKRPPSLGRNDRCHCGSGKKYKKCCLQKVSKPSKDSSTPRFTQFSPMFIPRLYSVRGITNDCELLRDLMDRDDDLKNVIFSIGDVEAFMSTHANHRSRRKRDAIEIDIDKLAACYVTEFPEEGKLLKDLKDRFLAAAPRAKSEDEMRALAAGFFFAMASETSTDTGDNILAAMIFRKTLTQVMRPYAVVSGIINQLGWDNAQLRERFESNDPQLFDELKKCCDVLRDSDKDALRAYVNRQHDELWEVISSDKFPILLPFVTMLPFWMAVHAFAKEGKEPKTSDFEQIMGQYSDEFLVEDARLYKTLLEEWLAQNRNRDDDVARAVKTMLGLCAVRSLDPFVKMLIVSTGRQQVLVTLDDKERGIIESWKEPNESEFLRTYSEWLRLKGYPLLADRTLALDSFAETGDHKSRWWKHWARNGTPSLYEGRS